MSTVDKTRTIYNFRSFCFSCFNRIDIPLLGDFAYGEILCQTKDGQDFYIAGLLDNPTFDFITSNLTQLSNLTSNKIDPQKVLVLLADKPSGKDFTTDYPICPLCKKRKRYFNDNTRTSERQVGFVTWTNFESLTQDNKFEQFKETVFKLI